jgi:diketogulonate reductase-like aldo/keto reductase
MTMLQTAMRFTQLPSGASIPVLGQGTWHMGEDSSRRDEEIAALRLGLDLGMTLIDNAEMYGDGAAERLVGEAIAGRRDQVFLVSKVLPDHASRMAAIGACDGSPRRLHTDYLDLYLLHWRGDVPLEETLDAFEDLLHANKIRYWGVSNFDVADMEDLFIAGGTTCAANQVLYNLTRRGIEYDLFPWCHQRGIVIMAYSPIEQGRMLGHPALWRVAERHHVTAAQVALAWVLRNDGLCAIPKSSRAEHVVANHAALELSLTKQDLADLDRAFTRPAAKQALEVI